MFSVGSVVVINTLIKFYYHRAHREHRELFLKIVRRTLQNLITEYDTYVIENRKKVFK